MTQPNPNGTEYIFETKNLDIFYGDFKAVTDVNMKIQRNKITAIIGPSGCGKSTLLRSFNRMNELVPGSTINGEVTFQGQNLYDQDVDPVEVRGLDDPAVTVVLDDPIGLEGLQGLDDEERVPPRLLHELRDEALRDVGEVHHGPQEFLDLRELQPSKLQLVADA